MKLARILSPTDFWRNEARAYQAQAKRLMEQLDSTLHDFAEERAELIALNHQIAAQLVHAHARLALYEEITG